MRADATHPTALRLGFACSWWRPRVSTWSYTPISLRAALIESGIELLDLEAQPPLPLQAALAGGLGLLGQQPWKYAPMYRALEVRRVRRSAERQRPDAIVEIADLVVPTVAPTWSYQDSGFAVALDHYEAFGRDRVSTFPTDRDTLRRLADAQHEALNRIDGLIAMGRWFAEDAVRRGVLPAHKVHAIGAGIAPAFAHLPPRVPRERAARTRVLFLGGEFLRKGGDWLLEAMAHLRRDGARALRLTVAGPARWPLASPPPDWVDFIGPVPREAVPALFMQHDLFAMPSRFEAYGIALLEARAAGLPCVARDAFAMPELVEPGVGGLLWNTADPRDLAERLQQALDDDALHASCAREASRLAQAFSWDRVAERLLHVVGPARAGATRANAG